MHSVSNTQRPRANVLGVGVDALDLPMAVARLSAAIEQNERGYVCVTGVHGVMEAQRDPEFRRILNGSLMTTPDGMPMVWVGRGQGQAQMDRVYGPDLMLELCRLSEDRGYTHFLYGGGDGVAEQLAESLRRRYPRLNVVGTFTPPFRPLSEDEEAALEEQVTTLRPDVIWVGLSTPKQERFMARYIERLPVKLMVGVGAAFDMHSGRLPQAPHWMQRSGLEWLYRLIKEPRRLFKRYAVNNPTFVYAITRQFARIQSYSLD